MAEFWDYSNLTNIEYRENQSTFYLDGTYINLPPNCVIETYYDRETNKYSYKFLMLTLLNNTDTEDENMQVATYVINGSGSVFMAYGNTSKYTPIPKFNRRDFLRRLFQYYISMINDKHHFMIYRPWVEHQLLMSYNTLYLRVKTGENEFVSIPYSGNDGPIIALYNSEGEQVFCSAYKYLNGQIYNSISSSIYLNNLAAGTYTVKLLRTGKGLLSFVGGKYSAVITIPKADRYHNADGTYNPANNTSKWINQPYNNLYLDFEAEYLEFDVVPTLKEVDFTYEKYGWTPPSYEAAENKVKAAYAELGIEYTAGSYSYEKYLEDFYTGYAVDPELEIKREENIPIYSTVFNVTAYVHKGTETVNRGTVSFTADITHFNTNVAMYTGMGNDYDPREYPNRINIDPYYIYSSLSANFGASFAGYAAQIDPFFDGHTINYVNPIVKGTVGSLYGYTGATIIGTYKTNVSADLTVPCSVSLKNLYYKTDDSPTSKVARVPCLSINAQAECDYVGYSPHPYEYYEPDNKLYDTPQENIDKRLEKYLVLRDKALQGYNAAAETETVTHETTQNGLKFDVPIPLLLGLIPREKLLMEVNGYAHDLGYYSNYCEVKITANGNKVIGRSWVKGLGGRSSSDMAVSGFEVPDIIRGSIDYTGYEQCEDYRNWVGTRIYTPTSIDIDLSEIPVK